MREPPESREPLLAAEGAEVAGVGRKKGNAAIRGELKCSLDRQVLSLLLLSWSFFLLFAPFSAIQNLESSLNAAEKLGPTALATLYTVYTAGCILAPAVVGTLGPKLSMLTGAVFISLFIAAHFRPGWNTLLPASALVGLWSAFMWAAQGVYITGAATSYAASVGKAPFSYLGSFNGMFWGVFNCNQIAGNLISSIILRSGHSESKGQHLFTIFLLLSMAATFFLSLLPRTQTSVYSDKPEPQGSVTMRDMLLSMVRIMRHRSMQYLLPIFMYSGAIFGFVCVDFTNVLVRGSLGIHQIGLVMSVFGLANGSACLLFGRLSDRLGRDPILLYGAVVHMMVFVFFLTWHLHTQAYLTLNIVAALTGTADAAWCTQSYAIIGARFNTEIEAGFATFRMWNSLGMATAFFLSGRLSWSARVCVLVMMLLTGAGCFVLLRHGEKWTGQPCLQRRYKRDLDGKLARPKLSQEGPRETI